MSRAALLLAGVSALAPLAALSAAAAAAAPAAERFFAPADPMILTRIVRRALPDGKEIVATRSYALRFAREGSGYRVDGELIECAVEAPEALRPMAEIERKRADSGLFPLHLDSAGRILEASQDGSEVGRREAAGKVTAAVTASGLSGNDKAEAVSFVTQLADRGGQAVWPADLFMAKSGERSEVRRLALPGGVEGTVSVATKVASGAGLAATLERTVTTEFAGTRRVVRETWAFRPS